jgi:hypothetical protein
MRTCAHLYQPKSYNLAKKCENKAKSEKKKTKANQKQQRNNATKCGKKKQGQFQCTKELDT